MSGRDERAVKASQRRTSAKLRGDGEDRARKTKHALGKVIHEHRDHTDGDKEVVRRQR